MAFSGEHRDREFERLLIRELAPAGIDVEPLIGLAQHRAELGRVQYGRDFPDLDRNLEMDGLEELGDCVQYVVWRLDQIRRGLVDDDDRTPHLQAALRGLTVVFDDLHKALR